jgi:toxin-antitoxin system PIN domain toxin
MTSSSFPDVNVWVALLMADHAHRDAASRWWDTDESEVVGFTRFTQVALLRLLTTSAAMQGSPLTMRKAWIAMDRLFADDRVNLLPEPAGTERAFRKHTSGPHASPKVWADAYLLAFAEQAGGRVVTFDRALAGRAAGSVLLT